MKERILVYVADRGGEIDATECAEALGLSRDEVLGALEDLRIEGRIEKEAEAWTLESTAIRSAGYDHKSGVLEIEFQTGGVYRYSGVPAEVYEGLVDADSPGRFFHRNIRGVYPSELVRVGERRRV